MSHELRTPLNSILILGQQLVDNHDRNLTPKQVEFARTIHGAGSDLLTLITDILDLSKIESGTVTVDVQEVAVSFLLETAKRMCPARGENRKLWFEVHAAPELEGDHVHTDSTRLLQVLKNLLSNAFKFTEKGGVNLNVFVAPSGWSGDHPVLNSAGTVVAFEVTDSGVGIAPEKQKIIFEAFQQADAGTAASTAARASGWPSAASSRASWAARSSCAARRQGQRLHALRAAALPGVGVVVERSRPESGRPRAAPRARTSACPTTATRLRSDEPRCWWSRRMRATRVRSWTWRTWRLPGAGGHARRRGARHGAQVPAGGHHARHAPAQHARLGPAQPAEAGHRPRATSRCRSSPWTRTARWASPAARTPSCPSAARRRSWARRCGTCASTRSPRRKRLMVVEDDPGEQLSITELLAHDDIESSWCESGARALEELGRAPCDCVVLDLRLPDMSGFEVLDRLAQRRGVARPAGGGLHRARALAPGGREPAPLRAAA
jgi:hypothetical protein